MHADAFTRRRFYTQKLLHTGGFTHRHFYTQTLLKHFYTQTLLHTKAFSHRSFYTQKLLHTDAFTHRRFYTQLLLHTNTFTHRHFYTQKLLHTDAFTHRRFYTQPLSHTPTSTPHLRFVQPGCRGHQKIAILPQFLTLDLRMRRSIRLLGLRACWSCCCSDGRRTQEQARGAWNKLEFGSSSTSFGRKGTEVSWHLSHTCQLLLNIFYKSLPLASN